MAVHLKFLSFIVQFKEPRGSNICQSRVLFEIGRERERERECVCVCVSERECVGECKDERERKREKEREWEMCEKVCTKTIWTHTEDTSISGLYAMVNFLLMS